MWSVSRGGLTQLQNFTYNDIVWFLYTNENSMLSYSSNCTTSSSTAGPYRSYTIVRNLFYPFENYTLGASDRPFFFDGKDPYFGCIGSITLQPYDFKALAPADIWIPPAPALTKFTPGHDARIEATDDSSNPNSIDLVLRRYDPIKPTILESKTPATLATRTGLGHSSQSCGQLVLDSGHGLAILDDATVLKKKSADAQAAFCARRANYIATLEEAGKSAFPIPLSIL